MRRHVAAAKASSIAMRLVAIASIIALIACADDALPSATDGRPTLADYPPMPFGAAPGASARARTAAASLRRGVNLGNMLEAPTEGAWGVAVTPDIIDKVVAAGFNSVRVPVRWSNHTGASSPYLIDPAFVARVDAVVTALLGRGLVVVMNMHHYRQLDGDGLDNGEYPVPNEVVDLRFVVLAARALGAVRRTNATRVVVIGPTQWNWAGMLSTLKLPNDANLVATVHDYAPFDFTHQGAEWVTPMMPTGVTCCNAAQVAEMIAPVKVAKLWSMTTAYPVFVGEFGAYSAAPAASRISFNRHMRDSMEVLDMGWHYWEFAAGFGVYDPVAQQFRAALLESLLGAPGPR